MGRSAEAQQPAKAKAASEKSFYVAGRAMRILQRIAVRLVTGLGLALALYLANALLRAATYHVGRDQTGTLLVAVFTFVALAAALRKRALFGARAVPVVAVAGVLYLLWALWARSVPVSDFAGYYAGAQRFADGDVNAALTAKSPVTVVYYGIAAWLLGPGYLAAQLAAITAWCAGGLLLVRAGVLFGVPPRTAVSACALLLLAPGTVFYSAVVSSEAVFFLLASAATVLALRASQSPTTYAAMAYGTGAGACLAALFLTRSIGAVFIGATIAFLLLRGMYLPRATTRALPALAGALVLSLLVSGLAIGASTGKGFTVNPNPFGTAVLLMGLNQETRGAYNVEDLEAAGFIGPNRVDREEAAANALRLALDRLRADPVGLLGFAVTEKVGRLWETDRQSLGWALRESPVREDMQASGALAVTTALGDVWHMMLLGAAVLGLAAATRRRLLPPDVAALVLLPPAGLAFLHLFWEVQPRYHVVFLPFVAFAAAYALGLAASWRQTDQDVPAHDQT